MEGVCPECPVVGTFFTSLSPCPSSFPLPEILCQSWGSPFIFSPIGCWDLLPGVRHCVRHSGDARVTRPWSHRPGAQSAWRTRGPPSRVVCVGPGGCGRSTAWTSPDVTGHPQSLAGGQRTVLCERCGALRHLSNRIFKLQSISLSHSASRDVLFELVLISPGCGSG